MPDFDRFDPKDLYDPRDPFIYRTKYLDLLHQTLANQVHDMWREWVLSLLQQDVIASDKVVELQKLLVPFHQLTPDDQRNHLIRTAPLVREFVNWKLIDQALAKGGPKKSAPVGGDDVVRRRR